MQSAVRTFVYACGVLVLATAPAAAAVFGTVKGVVHDAQHRPIPGAMVVVAARQSDWSSTTLTDANGEFLIPAVPVGDYTVAVSLDGFKTARLPITVMSNTVPALHVQLEVGSLSETVTVSGATADVRPDTVTPTTLVDRQDIRQTPGADRTNSLEAITAFVPGAYVTHDQLHVRGGHQVSWLVDGVPVPNTNIASNVGPQFDPKDIDTLEVERGSYDAQMGDRTYAAFNVVPRTGFERDNDAELTLSVGNYHQANGQASIGGHTERFAYFVSGNGNRSNLGLGTPVADVIHDRQSGGGGFASFIFNATPSNQLRVVTSLRHDVYQIPNTPEQQAASVDDYDRESDAFVNASWVRTSKTGLLMTVSPFFHLNRAALESGPLDFPLSTADDRRSSYAGAQATFGGSHGRHDFQVGVYGFHQQDNEGFSLAFNDGSMSNVSERIQPAGNLVTVFAQDKVTVTSWLRLTAGIRQTHFAGDLTENATSPRVGATVEIPSSHVVFRGFYGRFYQAPPLATASGPLLAFVNAENLGFLPLRGERDQEYQIGVAVPIAGWVVDADHFRTSAANYFDHSPLDNSNIFFPVTLDGALIRGTEFTLRSPRVWTRAQVHVAYAYQTARGHGAISGGLTDFATGEDGFYLDHDQRHTFSAGVTAPLRYRAYASGTVEYGSGFVDDEGPAHLPDHVTVNLSIGKTVTKRLSLAASVLNVFDSHLLIDNSLTFGGTHFNSPREGYVEVRYRFHY